jgi:hypothetical protein
VGLLAGTFSHADVSEFKVSGDFAPLAFRYLHTEGRVGAAQHREHWEEVRDSAFLYGIGAVSRQEGVSAKWNVACSGFVLWSPTGPGYGTAEVWVDDSHLGNVDFASEKPHSSQAVFKRKDLEPGYHAIWLKNVSGTIPLDVLETQP